jgi:hypothetical protein
MTIDEIQKQHKIIEKQITSTDWKNTNYSIYQELRNQQNILHEQAEKIRASYGYSGGSTGIEVKKISGIYDTVFNGVNASDVVKKIESGTYKNTANTNTQTTINDDIVEYPANTITNTIKNLAINNDSLTNLIYIGVVIAIINAIFRR